MKLLASTIVSLFAAVALANPPAAAPAAPTAAAPAAATTTETKTADATTTGCEALEGKAKTKCEKKAAKMKKAHKAHDEKTTTQ
jgi:hypothetical protein